MTGNPLRAEIAQIAPSSVSAGRSGPLQLLVIGGSLGAQALNENVPRALARVSSDLRAKVVHQCGAKHIDSVRALYREVGVDAEIVAFINDMPRGTQRQTSSSVAQVRSRFRSLLPPEWQACWFRLLRRRLHISEITRNTCRERRRDSLAAIRARTVAACRLVALTHARSATGYVCSSTFGWKTRRHKDRGFDH